MSDHIHMSDILFLFFRSSFFFSSSICFSLINFFLCVCVCVCACVCVDFALGGDCKTMCQSFGTGCDAFRYGVRFFFFLSICFSLLQSNIIYCKYNLTLDFNFQFSTFSLFNLHIFLRQVNTVTNGLVIKSENTVTKRITKTAICLRNWTAGQLMLHLA